MPEKCEPLEELQWHPNAAVDCDLVIYLQAARSMAAFAGMCDGGSPDDGCLAACRDDTTMNAMDMLHSSKYNTSKALQGLVKNPVPLSIHKKWSEDDQKRFVKGLRQYGKNFFRIRKDLLSHKETGDLVEFYYLWKKTAAASNARPHRRHRRQNVLRRIRTGTRGNSRPNNDYMDLSSASEEENDSDDSDSRDMSGYACHHCFTTTSKDWHHAGKGRTLLCTECRMHFKKYGQPRPLLEPREPPSFLFKPIKDEDSNSTSSTPVNGKHGMRTRRCKENSNVSKTRQRSSRPGSAASPDVESAKLGRKSPSTGSTCSNSSTDKGDKVKKKAGAKKEIESPVKGKRKRDGKSTPTSEIDAEDGDKDGSSPMKKCKIKSETRSESPSESTTTTTESGSVSNDDDQGGDRSSSPSTSESTPSSPNNVQQSSPTETDTQEEEVALENQNPVDMQVEQTDQQVPPPVSESVPAAPLLSRMPSNPVLSPVVDNINISASSVKQEDNGVQDITPPPVLQPIIKTEPISPEKTLPANEAHVTMPTILKIKEEPELHCPISIAPTVSSSSTSHSVSSFIPSSSAPSLPSLSEANVSKPLYHHHNILPPAIRSIETKDTPVVPVAPSILRESQRVTESVSSVAMTHLPTVMPSQKPFHGMLAASNIKTEPQETNPSVLAAATSSFITLPSSTSRSPITKPIATVAASVSQQRNSSPASVKPSSPPHSNKSSMMITTCAPSSSLPSTLASSTTAASSSPFSLHSFPPHVPLPPTYAHGLPPGAMHGMNPFAGYPYHLQGYPAPHPSLHPPVPPRPPSTVSSVCSSIVSSSPSITSHSSVESDQKSHVPAIVRKTQSPVVTTLPSATNAPNLTKEAGSSVDDPVTVEDDDDEFVPINNEPEPPPKIDNTEFSHSKSAIFVRHWKRGQGNSCCRTDVYFKPLPDSKLYQKREERLNKRNAEREEKSLHVKRPNPCKTPISEPSKSICKEEPPNIPPPQQQSSFDRHTPHRVSVSHDTPALRQLSEYARPHTAYSPNVPRSTPSSYPANALPGPSTGVIAPYGIGGIDPVLNYQISSGMYGPAARERLEMEYEREKRDREMRERELRERDLHEKLKAEMELKTPTSLASRFPQSGLPFNAPIDPHWVDMQRRYAAAAAAGFGPCGPPTSMHQNPFGIYPGSQGASNLVDRERLAAIQGSVPAGIPASEYERLQAERMSALAAAAANDPVLRLQLAAAGATGLNPAGLPPTSAEMHSHAHTHAHAHTHLHLHPHEMSPSIPPYPPLAAGENSPANAPGSHPLLPPTAGSFPRPSFPLTRDPGLLHVANSPGMLRPHYDDQLVHQISTQEHLQRQLMLERERFPPPGPHLPPHLIVQHEEYLRQARDREVKLKLRTLEEAARGNRGPYDGPMGGSSGGSGGVMDRT